MFNYCGRFLRNDPADGKGTRTIEGRLMPMNAFYVITGVVVVLLLVYLIVALLWPEAYQ